jgi:hypothetical protein
LYGCEVKKNPVGLSVAKKSVLPLVLLTLNIIRLDSYNTSLRIP